MSDATPHVQTVVITVTDGDKTATFRSVREHNWPGAKPQHVSHLIDSTAGMAKSAIAQAEEAAAKEAAEQRPYGRR
jgi:hypothetical protein